MEPIKATDTTATAGNDTAAAAPVKKPNTVTLDTPIQRGATTITDVTLRKPDAGALRGTTLNALGNLEVDALIKVLPRVTEPTLTTAEVSKMDPADLIQLGVVFADFLLTKAVKASLDSQTA